MWCGDVILYGVRGCCRWAMGKLENLSHKMLDAANVRGIREREQSPSHKGKWFQPVSAHKALVRPGANTDRRERRQRTQANSNSHSPIRSRNRFQLAEEAHQSITTDSATPRPAHKQVLRAQRG